MRPPSALRSASTLFAPPPSPRPVATKAHARVSRFVWRALLLALGLIGNNLAASPRGEPGAAPSIAAVAEKRDDLKGLRQQIESLRKEVRAAENKRASADDQLKAAEQNISQTRRELHKLAAERGRVESTMADLGREAQELESRLQRQQTQLGKLVQHQYVRGRADTLRLVLNGQDASQVARDAYYLGAIAEARRSLVADIGESLQRKQALAAEAKKRADEVAAIEAKQKEQHGKLVAQHEQRKVVLQRISARIAEQRREIGNLQRDEKQLSQLIARLARSIAAKSAPRREATETRAAPRPESRPNAKPAPRLDSNPEAAVVGAFGRLKGSLQLPARGVVSNRFGGARQEGSVWKGLFIRSNAGSEVKAIAGGRVVFADWMRGFGNLLIVDHGDSYLSVYGNNDALLKEVGDDVRGGETVAAVGNSGGNPESGLYFELRHQGRPLDPLKWVNLK